jgi:hypothetical protein
MLTVLGYSAVAEESENGLLEWECETLFHIANGSGHLVSQEPWEALESFDKAKSVLDKACEPHHPINSLITFNKIIAYDCLGFDEQCRQSIGSLFLAINENDNEQETDGTISLGEESENSKIAILFLQNLAILAPSSQVREFLFSLIEDMADQLLPAFEFAEPQFLEYESFEFDGYQNQFSYNQCKSLWKRIRKWTIEFADWIADLCKVCKGINDIKKAYKEWKKEGEHNLSYEEFKHYYNHNLNNSLKNR